VGTPGPETETVFCFGKSQVLAANVVPGSNSPLRTKNLVKPYHVYTVGGQKVGVVGINVKQKTEMSSSPSHGTYLLDEMTTAQRYIDELKNPSMGVNKIIVLSHVGLAKDLEMAAGLEGVDVIVGGDSHSLLGDAGELATVPGAEPVSDYPRVVTGHNGKTVCVVQAWQYAHTVGKLDVSFDSNGDVTACSGRPIFPLAEASTWKDSAGNVLTLGTFEEIDLLSSLQLLMYLAYRRFAVVYVAHIVLIDVTCIT